MQLKNFYDASEVIKMSNETGAAVSKQKLVGIKNRLLALKEHL